MKVLILAGYFPKPHNSAMGVWALEQAKALQKAGVEVVVVSPTPWIPKAIALTSKLKGWASVPVEYKWDEVRTYYPKCLFYPTKFIKYFYNRFPYLEYYPIKHTIYILVQSLLQEFPFDLIYCHHPLIEGMVGYSLKQRYNIPLVVIEHSLTDTQRALVYPHRRKAYTEILNSSNAIVTVSEKLANLMYKLFPQNSKKRIHIVRNGVDISNLSNKRKVKPAILHDKKIVLTVGWLGERKGHKYLIKAVKEVSRKIPNMKLFIIGRGEQENELRKLVKGYQLEKKIEFLGNKPHDEVLNYMSWCDVFALPSWDEPFPTVFPEAMGCGAPIIGTQGEGIEEVIENGKQGILVPPKDVNSLSQVLLTLLQDDNLARHMGEEGKKLVFENLSWELNAEKMIKIFKKVINKQSINYDR